MSELDHGIWGIGGTAFGLAFVALAVLSLLIPSLLHEAFRWRWSGRRIVQNQRHDPDPELIGLVAYGREGCLAAAFAGLWVRGLMPRTELAGVGQHDPGLSALQQAALAEAEAEPDRVPGPHQGSRVAEAVVHIEDRCRRAGLVRSRRLMRVLEIVRIALPVAVAVSALALSSVTWWVDQQSPSISLAAPLLILGSMAVMDGLTVRRITGRGQALVDDLRAQQQVGPASDGPEWLRERESATVMGCALGGFRRLRTHEPWFTDRLPDSGDPRPRPRYRSSRSSGAGSSTGGGGHGCGSSCGGGGGCGGG